MRSTALPAELAPLERIAVRRNALTPTPLPQAGEGLNAGDKRSQEADIAQAKTLAKEYPS